LRYCCRQQAKGERALIQKEWEREIQKQVLIRSVEGLGRDLSEHRSALPSARRGVKRARRTEDPKPSPAIASPVIEAGHRLKQDRELSEDERNGKELLIQLCQARLSNRKFDSVEWRASNPTISQGAFQWTVAFLREWQIIYPNRVAVLPGGIERAYNRGLLTEEQLYAFRGKVERSSRKSPT
jgi:hypothetical protein